MEKCGYHLGSFLRSFMMRMGKNKIQTFNRDESCVLTILPIKVWISIKFGCWPKSGSLDFGQHHIEAMRQMEGGKDVIVPCIIHTGMTYAEEADMYAALDTDKTPLTPRQYTKALVEAGSDARITEIKRLVEAGGFTWALDVQTGEPYEIAPIRALINAYQLLGGAAFSRMLALMAGAWQGTPHSLRASMLSGMALFVKTYETELIDRTFIRRMSVVGPDEIIRQGRIDCNASLRFACIIWENYNFQQSGGLELPYRFKR